MSDKNKIQINPLPSPIILPKDRELAKLTVQHNIDIEDKQIEIEKENIAWKSCCFNLHPSSTKFFGKLTISLIVISLCSYQLITNVDNCTAQLGYSSLLSLTLGSWLNIIM
jgi:hypothetical protein